ncbi:MAG: hypothetical protein M3O15_14825 [Acidobacteriota bacterium]|nr:hypothetical protein [Acidobacteriota bacterium]
MPGPAAAPVPSRDFPAAVTLLPHAPPARFVRQILEVDPYLIQCTAEIPAAYPLVREGLAPGFVGLEVAAQAAAVMEALRRHEEGEGGHGPQIGYLVKISDARFLSPLPAERLLNVAARLLGTAPPLSIYEVNVNVGDDERSLGTISTYLVGAD